MSETHKAEIHATWMSCRRASDSWCLDIISWRLFCASKLLINAISFAYQTCNKYRWDINLILTNTHSDLMATSQFTHVNQYLPEKPLETGTGWIPLLTHSQQSQSTEAINFILTKWQTNNNHKLEEAITHRVQKHMLALFVPRDLDLLTQKNLVSRTHSGQWNISLLSLVILAAVVFEILCR